MIKKGVKQYIPSSSPYAEDLITWKMEQYGLYTAYT